MFKKRFDLFKNIIKFLFQGVLPDIQEYFSINDALSGFLQTSFTCSFMFFSPLFGYLGDRYQRKWIIIFGILFWSFMTLLGSFVPRDVKNK
jgi:MFS transporter, Spinster family, sphingosine-1-phosphate transporter